MNKRILSIFFALLLALSVVFAVPFAREAAIAEEEWTVPEGYNEHDYNTIVAFLEQTNENGIKNGTLLNADYDPNDPGSWGEDNNPWNPHHRFSWEMFNDEMRIAEIRLGMCNLNGELVLDACSYLCHLDCGYNSLDRISVSDCNELQWLYCQSNYLTELDVSSCLKLRVLWCENNNLGMLDLSNNAELIHLYFGNDPFGTSTAKNHIREIDLSHNMKLEVISCDYMQMDSFSIPFCESLWMLGCRECGLNSIDVSNAPALESLSANGNCLSAIDLSNNVQLRELALNNNNLTELDISNCSLLESLWCDNNRLSSLDVSHNTGLSTLNCSQNRINDLNLNDYVRNLYCTENPLNSIDLSNCKNFQIDTIRTFGNGYVGCIVSIDDDSFVAASTCKDNSNFEGWFNEEGDLLSTDEELDLSTFFETEKVFIAQFTDDETLIGDANGDGAVDTEDALLVLRAALGIDGDPETLLEGCDMDENGAIDTTDALLILRLALGIS